MGDATCTCSLNAAFRISESILQTRYVKAMPSYANADVLKLSILN
jgi:hypothetical protein